MWRALRVEPIEAIRTGHLAARSSRLTGWTGRLRIPGSTMTQMPVRNVLRTPRRTALTAIGVAAAITALVAVLGMLDSFGRTLDQGRDEFTRGDADRVVIRANSDAAIVSGLIALLTRLYSGASARQIVDTKPEFIEALGLQQHLSPTRANGLHAMLNAIRSHAQALL